MAYSKRSKSYGGTASFAMPSFAPGQQAPGPEQFGGNLEAYYQYLYQNHLPQEHYIPPGAGGTGQSPSALRRYRGSSRASRYSEADAPFCGPSGGSAFNTYPQTTPGRARAALGYARHAPDEMGIRQCVELVRQRQGWSQRLPFTAYSADTGEQMLQGRQQQLSQNFKQQSPYANQALYGNPEQYYTLAQPLFETNPRTGRAVRLARSTQRSRFPGQGALTGNRSGNRSNSSSNSSSNSNNSRYNSNSNNNNQQFYK
jgi:hypothetical protein